MVEGFGIAGVWSGYYYYPKIPLLGIEISQPVKFTAVFKQDSSGQIFGDIYEPKTFGLLPAEHLEAEILDFEFLDNGVRFIKKYNGMGGARHRVTYEGSISPDGNVIAGAWRISWLGRGTFEIHRELLE
ncbi:MAG TPA: hypothetical protein VGP72_09375 [Planctomycetota bacterium]|jgi:hypothetical protein